MREFVSCVKVQKMTEEEYDKLEKEMNNPSEDIHWGINRNRTGGRETSKTFLLHPGHPLAKTYCLQMLSKQKAAIMAGGKPPTYPVYTTEENQIIPPALRLKQNEWGAYIIANYWPYSLNNCPTTPKTSLHHVLLRSVRNSSISIERDK